MALIRKDSDDKEPTLKNLLAEDKKQFEKELEHHPVKEEPKKEEPPKHEEKKEVKTNLDTDFAASAARLEELKAGRSLGDIPMDDDYFKAVRKHMAAHNPLTNKKES